jgi:tRNA A-37 threonylcarbamoyl transferase component Bud32
MEELKGGREGRIFRDRESVVREASDFTKNIHLVLNKMNENGFDKVPKPMSFSDDGVEVVSYIHGDVSNYPLTPEFSSNQAMCSAGKLLREFHDVGKAIIDDIPKDLNWMLKSDDPMEVVCHGDYAPYNVVLKSKEAIGIIDFDTMHLGSAINDISYGMYRWATLFRENSVDRIGELNIQVEKARHFCEGYGIKQIEKNKLIDSLIGRLEDLVKFMRNGADAGEENFIENIKDGHDLGYLDDIIYIKKNRETIINGIFTG